MGFFKKMLNNNRRSLTSQRAKDFIHEGQKVSPSIEENVAYIQDAMFHTADLKTREISFNGKRGVLIFLNTTADFTKIEQCILTPLSRTTGEKPLEEVITSPSVEKNDDLNKVIKEMIHGRVIIFFEGMKAYYVVKAYAIYKREVSEPYNEKVIRGSHEGFVENLIVNIHLIRKRIESRHLSVKYHTVGKDTKTKMAIIYMQNLANPDVVQEVERRILSIDADSILSPGFVEEYLEGRTYSPFPQMLNTERPDRVMGNLMEGRVAIIMEGSPSALIVPVTFSAFYQSPDDYNSRPLVSSFFRLIRFSSFLAALLLPSFYIAVISFHYEVVPSALLFPMKSSVEYVPFPPLMEAFLLEVIIELIREGGIRLPSPVGQTIGIVGGLVIGQSAVQAALVSNIMIIVVAVTAISSFVVPSNEMGGSVRILRFPMMVLAGLFGFLGIMTGLLLILIHLTRLESFGTPYFSPAIPFRLKDMKDTIVRLAVWQLNERPVDAQPQRLNQERYSRGWKRNAKRKK